MSLDWVLGEMCRAERGLAPHYLFLYAAVVGMEARQVVEFGTGRSTRVILAALRETGGWLVSFSTETVETIRAAVPGLTEAADAVAPRWMHHAGPTSETLPAVGGIDPYELVLHDGAHHAPVVEADLRWALPGLRRYGLCLVHDTQHERWGPALAPVVARLADEFDCSEVTLPYGFGLTVLRRETGGAPWVPTRRKVGSPYRTVPGRTSAIRAVDPPGSSGPTVW